MRLYILSPKEKRTIKRYLETGECLDGFSVLLHRCKYNLPQIKEDLGLIEQLLQKEERIE